MCPINCSGLRGALALNTWGMTTTSLGKFLSLRSLTLEDDIFSPRSEDSLELD